MVGTDAAWLVILHLAKQLIFLHAQPVDVAIHLEKMVEAHPLYPVLTSMPGVAVRTAALASYAGNEPKANVTIKP